MRLRVLRKTGAEIFLKRFFEKSFKKVWKFENNAYLCSPVRKTGNKKFIEKTENCTRSKYRENTIYREALISFEIRSVSIKLEIYKNYTMKSLILAQDER